MRSCLDESDEMKPCRLVQETRQCKSHNIQYYRPEWWENHYEDIIWSKFRQAFLFLSCYRSLTILQ